MRTSDKHSNLLGQFLSYEENEVLRIRTQLNNIFLLKCHGKMILPNTDAEYCCAVFYTGILLLKISLGSSIAITD
jgi:hypothetical protein